MNNPQPISPEEENQVFTPGLATLDTDEQDTVPVNKRGSGPMMQYMIVAFVCLVGVGLLFWMRSEGLGPSEALAELKIDYPLDENGSAVTGDQRERVMSDLSRLDTPVQVPGDRIEKNPFVLVGAPAMDEDGPTEAFVDSAALERERAKQRFRSSVASLKLGSVVGGTVPMAIINGKAYRVGDQIEPGITLSEVDGRTVTVAGDDGATAIISMDDE